MFPFCVLLPFPFCVLLGWSGPLTRPASWPCGLIHMFPFCVLLPCAKHVLLLPCAKIFV
jgi:hypothetical protein